LIQIVIKLLASFQRIDYPNTGDLRYDSSPVVGYENVHVAVAEATRL
jgi:hypothetical protein